MKIKILVLVNEFGEIITMNRGDFDSDEHCEMVARDHMNFRNCGSEKKAIVTWVNAVVKVP